MKARQFSLAVTVVLVMLATLIGVAPNNVYAQSVCSPATAISVPFAKDGTGTFCYQASSLCSYINSWNLTTLEVNGTAYTNIWVSGSSIAPLNGTYTIRYVSPVAWGHFEIGAPCTGGPTAGPTATRTRTPTPGGPTATRTRTPTIGGPTATRTRTPTRTNTPMGPVATRTRTPTQGSVGSWPTAQGEQAVTASIAVSGTFDGGMRRYFGSGPLGTGGQDEDQDALFELANGATLRNVILGNPAADGIHCAGTCTLENVWWEDVGEDAATFRGSSQSLTYLVSGGGARHASDKIFQHNGAGTLTIRNFQAEDFGKLVRSCGNCSTQYQRDIVVQNVVLTDGDAVVGINTNYGDTARFTQIRIVNDSSMAICDKYTGNDSGDEPVKIGTGADGVNCIYSSSDIIFQ
jgi:hypothetical protein